MVDLVVNRHRGIERPFTARYSYVFRHALIAFFVGLAYFVGAKIGFALTFQPHPVSTLWPPNSILFAALLVCPTRQWWFVLLAAFPAHLLVELNAHIPLALNLGWYVSNCSEVLIGAAILRYVVGSDLRLDNTFHVGVFILASICGAFFSSFLDAGFVIVNKFGEGPYWHVFRMRFFSNVLASLTLVPAIVIWVKGGLPSLRNISTKRYVEASLLAIGLVVTGGLTFGVQRAGQNTTPALLYLPLPLLLWAAIRFGPTGSSSALLAVTFFAIWGAINDLGPFVTQSPEMNAFSVQLFLIVAAMPLMFLAAVIKERDETSDRNHAILRAMPDLVFLFTRQGIYLDHNPRKSNRWLKRPETSHAKSVRETLPHEIAEQVMECLEKTETTDEPQVLEYSLKAADGDRHYEARLIGMEGGDKTLSIVRDVTDRQQALQALSESERELHRSHRQIRKLLGRVIDVQEAERRRISRELHDDLNQKIATLSVEISRLKRSLPLAESELIIELDHLRENANGLTDEVRKLSHQLHPAVLEHLGLVTALESYVDRFKDEEQIEVRLTSELGDEKVPFQTSICLYRVAVEALRNVSRHSGASSASISLKRLKDSLELEVSDSGKGFDVDAFRLDGGLGLVSIEERLRLLHGSCEIHSSSENGTTLVARVPLTI